MSGIIYQVMFVSGELFALLGGISCLQFESPKLGKVLVTLGKRFLLHNLLKMQFMINLHALALCKVRFLLSLVVIR